MDGDRIVRVDSSHLALLIGFIGFGLVGGAGFLTFVGSTLGIAPNDRVIGANIPEPEARVLFEIGALSASGVYLLLRGGVLGALAMIGAGFFAYLWTGATGHFDAVLLASPLLVSGGLGSAHAWQTRASDRLGRRNFDALIVGVFAFGLTLHVAYMIPRIYAAEKTCAAMRRGAERLDAATASLAAMIDEERSSLATRRVLERLEHTVFGVQVKMNSGNAGRVLERSFAAWVETAVRHLGEARGELFDLGPDLSARARERLDFLASDLAAGSCLLSTGFETCGEPSALDIHIRAPVRRDGDVISVRAGMRVPVRIEAVTAGGERILVAASAHTRIASEEPGLIVVIPAPPPGRRPPESGDWVLDAQLEFEEAAPSARLRVDYDDISTVQTFRVLPPLPPVKSVSLLSDAALPANGKTIAVNVGTVLQVRASAEFNDGVTRDVTNDPAALFYVMNSESARISPDGKIEFTEPARHQGARLDFGTHRAWLNFQVSR